MSTEESSSKKHRGAGESSPSNSQTDTGTRDGGDSKQITPSGNLHPRLVEALSQVPYSPLFGILWPIIVEQASFDSRDLLRKAITYFETLCRPYRRSDRARRAYASYHGNRETREGLPFVFDLSFDAEWRCWGADKCGFNSVEAFRAFCALGNIDPDQRRTWDPYASFPGRQGQFLKHIWMSRTKDVVMETSQNPLEGGYCHYFGLTGVADKAIAMYNFMHDNNDPYHDYDAEYVEPPMTTMWGDMSWDRDYI